MTIETFTKEQITALLADRLNCSTEALNFLFNLDSAQGEPIEPLNFPEQRLQSQAKLKRHEELRI